MSIFKRLFKSLSNRLVLEHNLESLVELGGSPWSSSIKSKNFDKIVGSSK